MNRIVAAVVSLSLSCSAAVIGLAAPAAADPVTVSREYKLMLAPSAFNGNAASAAAAVASYWTALKNLIQNGSILRPTSGNLSGAPMIRTVRFYDTPGTCVIRRASYSFRERVLSGQREVTLKFLSPDRYISNNRDMTGEDEDSETKFEEDISAPFRSSYAHSTTQPIGSGKNLNFMDDPVGLYPGLSSMGFNENEAIAIVGNLSVYERVYEGASVDLGAFLGEFSLALWYASSTSTTPLLAEISFKYKDASGAYTNPVVTRAKTMFEAMQGMTTWTAPSALFKTEFVYQYDPNFCLP